jgi:protein-disulfide isomerase
MHRRIDWHNKYAMRFLLLLLPALANTALAQTPATSLKKVSETKAAAPSRALNYKESGSPSAPITFELYTDYECPACRAFFLDVLPNLTRDFVATGKVRLIHRDFRLPQHQYSKLATRYANAAGQIGKFDVVTQAIFQAQPEWSQNGNIDAVVAKVLTSPADMEKVRALVKNDTHLDDITVADEAMANNLDHLNQTPTIVIVAKGKREVISGGMPYAILKQYLQQKLQ